MARTGPLFTLLAGATLGVALLVASMAATPEDPADDEAVAAPTDSPTDDPTESPAEPTDGAGEDPYTPAPTDTPSEDPDDPYESPAPPAEPVTYVGYVDGGAASVAIIVEGNEALAYLCDGASAEAWLSGTATDGQLELTGERGSLTASYDGPVAEGESTVDGMAWTFSIAQVEPPEGLYRFADTIAGGAEVVAGWIVTPDGRQVGAVNVDGETRPAQQLDPETGQVTIEEDEVTADLVDDMEGFGG